MDDTTIPPTPEATPPPAELERSVRDALTTLAESIPAAPRPQLPPVPDEVAEMTTTTIQIAELGGAANMATHRSAQTVAAALLAEIAPRLYVAWLGGRELVELPEPDELVSPTVAHWGTEDDPACVYADAREGVVATTDNYLAPEQAERQATRVLAAAAWLRDRQAPAALAEHEGQALAGESR